MEFLVKKEPTISLGALGLEEIIIDKPPTKVVREFFRAQAGDICAREDRDMLTPLEGAAMPLYSHDRAGAARQHGPRTKAIRTKKTKNVTGRAY